MNCEDFWKKYEKTGLTRELEIHTRECLSCRNELFVEHKLDKALQTLPQYEAPDTLWNAICDELDEASKYEAPKVSVTAKIREFFAALIPSGIKLIPKPVLAGAILTLLVTSTVMFNYSGSTTPEERIRRQDLAMQKIEQTESDYLDAIDTLSALAEENKGNMDPEIYEAYMMKLAVLDEYIIECREAIQQNDYNSNARTYLAMAYMEKTDTLKEMINYKPEA